MELIRNAILEGQKNVFVNGILFERLPVCPRDTQKRKEKFATDKANQIFEALYNNKS